MLARLTTDVVTLDRAVAAVTELEPLSRCADTEALLAPVALPSSPITVAAWRSSKATVGAHSTPTVAR